MFIKKIGFKRFWVFLLSASSLFYTALVYAGQGYFYQFYNNTQNTVKTILVSDSCMKSSVNNLNGVSIAPGQSSIPIYVEADTFCISANFRFFLNIDSTNGETTYLKYVFNPQSNYTQLCMSDDDCFAYDPNKLSIKWDKNIPQYQVYVSINNL